MGSQGPPLPPRKLRTPADESGLHMASAQEMVVMFGDSRLRGVSGTLPLNRMSRLCQQLGLHCWVGRLASGLGLQEARASPRVEHSLPFVIICHRRLFHLLEWECQGGRDCPFQVPRISLSTLASGTRPFSAVGAV